VKLAVVDLDETLFLSTRRTKIIWMIRNVINKVLNRLAFACQKPNRLLLSRLETFDNIVILTGRSPGMRKASEEQLARHGVRYGMMIFRPPDLYLDWKKSVVEGFSSLPGTSVEWFDDECPG